MARGEQDWDGLPLDLVAQPHIRLSGAINDGVLQSFLSQIEGLPTGDGPVAVELTTEGGDAETGRRIALEIGLARQRLARRLVFIGKTMVYSAGVTIMGGFPRGDRFLTHDAMLLVHSRTLQKNLLLEGPLKASLQRTQRLVAEIENGIRLEREGYAQLIAGSGVTMEEIEEKADRNWYIPAPEALDRGLVAGLV